MYLTLAIILEIPVNIRDIVKDRVHCPELYESLHAVLTSDVTYYLDNKVWHICIQLYIAAFVCMYGQQAWVKKVEGNNSSFFPQFFQSAARCDTNHASLLLLHTQSIEYWTVCVLYRSSLLFYFCRRRMECGEKSPVGVFYTRRDFSHIQLSEEKRRTVAVTHTRTFFDTDERDIILDHSYILLTGHWQISNSSIIKHSSATTHQSSPINRVKVRCKLISSPFRPVTFRVWCQQCTYICV